MAQTWNDPAMPWQVRTLPWKDLSVASNDPTQPYKADPRTAINILKRDASSKLLKRNASSKFQREH